MGKRGRGGKGGSRPPPRDQQQNGDQGSRGHGRYRPDVNTHGTKIEAYYKAMAILDEDQLEATFNAFRQPLPTTFRVTGSRANGEDINDHIKEVHVHELADVVFDGQKQDPPQQIPWYPGGLAWTFNVAKKVIRKSFEFKKFQSFLVHETEAGNLSRQEAVSMIPPLLLDVAPAHAVLDLCAAPGSKSAQLLEALHAVPGVDPTGFLLANDSDAKRTHMLIHQTLGRLGSPNMMVTNLDASNLPNMRIRTGVGADMTSKLLYFDRILADVPCTGDGTLRKNVEIWGRFNVWEAIGLHGLQLRILLRGIKNLKPGGRLVYSTCSLNPIENEAVVSAALAASKEAVSLVDVSDRLLELKRAPALHSWRILDDDLQEIPPVEAGATERVHKTKTVPATVWPNGREAELHLERCLRIYPHLQDTGGFFVAVLEKPPRPERATVERDVDAALEQVADAAPAVVAVPVTSAAADSTEAAKPSPASDAERPAKRPRTDDGPTAAAAEDGDAREGVPTRPGTAKNPGREFREEPYTYLSADNDEMRSTLSFFGIRLSTFDAGNLLVRNNQGLPLRTVYHTSASVRRVVEANDYQRIRLVSCGAKLFARQDANRAGGLTCKWRLMSDSVAFVRPHMDGEKRVVACGLATLRTLMAYSIPVAEMPEEEVRTRMETMDQGSALLEVRPGEDTEGAVLRRTLVVPMWLAPKSVQVMVEKKEKSALSQRVFGADITSKVGLKKPPTGDEVKAEPGVNGDNDEAKPDQDEAADEQGKPALNDDPPDQLDEVTVEAELPDVKAETTADAADVRDEAKMEEG